MILIYINTIFFIPYHDQYDVKDSNKYTCKCWGSVKIQMQF